MNAINRNNIDVVEKFKIIRSLFDKIFITIAGCMWIFSTLWDIYRLQRYWLDYCIEFYSSFLIFYMIIYSLNPNSLPKKIYNSFKAITTIRGRGCILLIISSIFLNDSHAFHKFCAIIFFIGGILYFICEILVPSTKEELDKIDAIYNQKVSSNIKKEDSREVQIDNRNNVSQIDKSTQVLSFEQNNKTNMTNINNNESNAIDNIKNSELVEEIKENSQNEDTNNKQEGSETIENEVIRKTDNPYEIPEDF